MLTMRLLRTGKRGQPFFRIVVINKKSAPRAGRFVEIVGFCNPLTKEKQLKTERIQYWLSVGAKPSDTLYNLLVSEKIITGKKIDVAPKAKKSDDSSSQPQTFVAESETQASSSESSNESESASI